MNSRLQFGFALLAVALTTQAGPTNTNPPPIAATNAVSGTNSDAVSPELYARSVLGEKAPKFQIEKWITPAPSMEGKFVLIDFWATWCVPCRKSIPELNGFHAKYKDRLVIIGVTDETEAQIQKTTLPKIEYAIASDPDERMMNDLKIESLPHSLLIDPSGIVRYQGNPLYLDEEKLQHLLETYSH